MSAETIERIAKSLGESEETPLKQIQGVIRALGEDSALALLAETEEIESKGGMLVPDGSRRRTPGGVFFRLARERLSRDDKIAIFMIPQQRIKAERAAKEPRPRPRVVDVAELSGRGRPQAKPFRAAQSFGGGGRSDEPRFDPAQAVDEVRRSLPSIAFGLEAATKRAEMRYRLTELLSELPERERYAVLLDALAELHAGLVGEADQSAHQLAGTVAVATKLRDSTPPPPASQPPASGREPEPTPSSESKPSRGGTVQQRVLDAIASGDATNLADLADRIYGEDSPQTRNRVQSTIARLKSAGKVTAVAPGQFKATGA